MGDCLTICPLCSASDILILWSDTMSIAQEIELTYDFIRCHRCNLHFIHPLPEPEVIQAFYRKFETSGFGPYSFHEYSSRENYSNSKILIAKARYPEGIISIDRRAKQILAIVAELLVGRRVSFCLGIPFQLPLSAKILDIGCGAGDWLVIMMQTGYRNVLGQDIAGPSKSRLEQYNIPIVTGDLTKLQLELDSFDLIRMEHVLEHLADPLGYIDKVAQLLKRNGRLVITLPYIDSLSFKLTKRQWNPLQPLYHLRHYSCRTLKMLAEKNGLRLSRFRYMPVYEVMITSLFKDESQPQRLLRTKPLRIWLEPIYGLFMRLIRNGDFITAEFIKPPL